MTRDEPYEDDDFVQETNAILNCLEYLRREAMSSGLEEAARYIAMAVDSVHRTVIDSDDGSSGGGNYFPGVAGSGPH